MRFAYFVNPDRVGGLMDELMDTIKDYRSILVELEKHQRLYEIAEKDRDYYLKQMYASEPHDVSAINIDGQPRGGFSPISLDRAYEYKCKAESMMELEQYNIDSLKKQKKAIENSIKKLDGLEYKVAFKRIFERNEDGSHKTLEQIAAELNYSLAYIKHISANVSKKFSNFFEKMA